MRAPITSLNTFFCISSQSVSQSPPSSLFTLSTLFGFLFRSFFEERIGVEKSRISNQREKLHLSLLVVLCCQKPLKISPSLPSSPRPTAPLSSSIIVWFLVSPPIPASISPPNFYSHLPFAVQVSSTCPPPPLPTGFTHFSRFL